MTKKRKKPTIENGTVPPRRVKNHDRRTREHLTPSEVEELMETARQRGRYGHRDATMILLAYRHGFRVAELCALRWEQIDVAARNKIGPGPQSTARFGPH